MDNQLETKPNSGNKQISELDRLKLSLINEKLKRNKAEAHILQTEAIKLQEQRNALMAAFIATYDIKQGASIDIETGEVLESLSTA